MRNDLFSPLVLLLGTIGLVLCGTALVLFCRHLSQRRIAARIFSLADGFAEYKRGAICGIYIAGEGFDGRAAPLVKQLHWVEELDLDCTGLIDDDLTVLEELTHLRALWICPKTISEAGLQHLSRLQQLSFLKLRIDGLDSDRSLKCLNALKNLNYLVLSGRRHLDEGVLNELRAALPEVDPKNWAP